MNTSLGNLLRLESLESIDGWSLSFAAAWAERNPVFVLVGCLAAAAAAGWFYLRYQPELAPRRRAVLAALRAAVLSLLVVMLADPVLRLSFKHAPRPLLWVLFDGTESMAIEDDLDPAERAALTKAVGLEGASAGGEAAAAGQPRSRQDFVAAWVRKQEGNVLAKLAEKFRLKAAVMNTADTVRTIDLGDDGGGGIDGDLVARQLTTTGQVTALGKALDDLALRHASGSLQGVVVVSDFDQNAGPPAAEAATKLAVPVYTVGIGPGASVDLGVDLQAPPLMKKSERASVVVTLRQTGLKSAEADVSVTARLLEGPAESRSRPEVIGQKTVALSGPTVTVEFPVTPERIGRHEFAVEVTPLDGETIVDNNRSEREVNIRDDFLRLMDVEYEPTWEWRFIKEVFHRDPLVGMRGFRTFLRSADPQVRKSNELFLPTPAPARGEFFTNDVIFLGDMPASAISPRFGEMTREFVETFGGGLVVIAGNRFGPGQLFGTPLADMLPVVLDGGERPVEKKPFEMQLSADAGLVDFMQLGEDDADNRKAWANLGPLPWYQPVARPHPQATVLAVHPTDTCVDGKTRQPIIAIRRYGRGQVVYVGTNETWRLRRNYGERYYRQFWGQMIHRLGLSHALGSQKRFVVRTDAPRYQSDDTVVVTVEAYDANFEPLSEQTLPGRKLAARLFRPQRDQAARDSDGEESEPVTLAQLRPGVFETRLPVNEGGGYRLRVADPVTQEESEVAFTVTSLSAERRSAVRNVALQNGLAAETSGRSYDLLSADAMIDDIKPAARSERSVRVFPLSMTWLCFGTGVLLMVGEWILRKRTNLP